MTTLLFKPRPSNGWLWVGAPGLLFLPFVAGLWIWQTPSPLWLRLILVLGFGIATVYTFFSKQG